MKKVLILFSGGLESRFLLQHAMVLGYTPFCLLVDYEQKHKQELQYAEQVCTDLAVSYQQISVVNLGIISALTGVYESGKYEGVSPWYVPSRNLIFIALAVSVAESKDIDEIWIGTSFTDRLNNFPDCSQEWVVAVNKVLEIGLSKKIQVLAPLLGLPKEMIWQLAEKAGIKKEEVFSGYGE